MSFEELVDGSLSQTSHLPPVGEEGEPGPEEADGVDEDDEDDDQIVIQKLGCSVEGNDFVNPVLRSQPTGKLPDVRDDMVIRIPVGVHDHCDQAHKEGRALGVGEVDDEGLDRIGGFDLFE